VLLPWMPAMRRAPVAQVNLANCNGCKRCADDCPYNAISMEPRTDGLPFEHEAVVDPAVCVSCGICAGACPTSTPFRRASALIPGIDLPHRPLRDLRAEIQRVAAGLTGPSRVLLIGCDHGGQLSGFAGKDRAAVSLPCTAALPPSFIDYALSRNLADGIVITGCREGNCHNRFGIAWMTGRLARRRDPYLRQRVAADRLLVAWGGTADRRRVAREIAAFQLRLATLPPTAPARAKGEALNA
jgi:ferredoxin/coenzyme F420-reducing hydrogenase delta subunit